MKHPKSIYANNVNRIYKQEDAPAELWSISEKWSELSDKEGDQGSCVLGAGFLFKYQKKWFFMVPRTRWQGSCSWEVHIDTIRADLEALGVSYLRYEWGNMD